MRKFNCKILPALLAAALIFSSCSRINENSAVEIMTEGTEASAVSSAVSTAVSAAETAEIRVTAVEAETELSTEETTSDTLEVTSAESSAVFTIGSDETLQLESPPEIPAAEVAVSSEEYVTVSSAEVLGAAKNTTAAAEISVASSTHDGYLAMNYSDQRGVWISYLEYSRMLQQKTEKQFRAAIDECFDNVKNLGFNTVYVHARANGDAYYDSDLFPTGDRYNGTIDADMTFDPLQIIIEEAHARELSVHAWVNPLRLMSDSQMKRISDSYQIKKWYDGSKNGTYLVKYNDRWYLNPAYSAVTDLIADGISEIADNYDVDGIQIDDYFYPTTASSFDKTAYSSSKTSKSLTDWRLDNVSRMVKKLCKAVHSSNSTAVFGISPQASVQNDYDMVYADVKKWCQSTDYCDYILPQVYYGFDNAAEPYKETIAAWNSMTKGSGVQLVIGLAAYKIGLEDKFAGSSGKNEWINNSDIISRQIAAAEKLSGYGGVALYRYDSVFVPEKSVSAQVKKEIANIK